MPADAAAGPQAGATAQAADDQALMVEPSQSLDQAAQQTAREMGAAEPAGSLGRCGNFLRLNAC